MMFRNNRRLLKNHAAPEISLTPLIDTALVLLVIFMVTAPMMNNSLKIDLPKGSKKEAKSDSKDWVIYIDANEKIYLDDIKEPKKIDEIIKLLEKKIGSKKDQKVFVNADSKISYGTVIKVVDRIKYVGGVDNVILSTQAA